jgi:two-component system, NarL family, nitrate/nitrite response regulator NarP
MKFRALIVEDDSSWRQILGEILVDMGMEVDYASNYQEAMDGLHHKTHRFAILDLSLGGPDHNNQDGFAVAEMVQRYEPACAIIFLTGFATVEIAVSVMREYNAVTCLRKEIFRRSEFRSLINQVLSQPPTPSKAREEEAGIAINQPNDGDAVQIKYQDLKIAMVVEDDSGWRSLLSELLEDSGYQVRTASSYVEALGLLKHEKVSLVVLDLSLASSLTEKNMDGYRLLNGVKSARVPAIVVSGYAEPARIEQAFANGFIIACFEKKAFDRKSFQQVIDAAQAGSPEEDPVLKTLTDREREVLELIALGMTNKEIANKLTITANTVKRHLKSLFTKLNVNTRSAASARAITLHVLKD